MKNYNWDGQVENELQQVDDKYLSLPETGGGAVKIKVNGKWITIDTLVHKQDHQIAYASDGKTYISDPELNDGEWTEEG